MDVGNLVHFLLRRVHVPDINMDFLSLPSGFENMVMTPWQWIPPPLMTPPHLLPSLTSRVADHVGLLLLGIHGTIASCPQVSRFIGPMPNLKFVTLLSVTC